MDKKPYRLGMHEIPPALVKRNKMILALHRAGHSLADIARQMDLTRQRVYQIVRRDRKEVIER